MRTARFNVGRRRLSTMLAGAMLMRHGPAWGDLAVSKAGGSPSAGGAATVAETLFDIVFANLSKSSHQPIVFSPLCLADALNLLLAGAAGKTAHDLSPVSESLLEDANRDTGGTTATALQRASALWLSKQVHAGRAATQINLLSDSADEAVRQINAWSSQKTNGLIPTILDRLPDHSPLVATSALHFGDQWRARFDPADTKDALFRRVGGSAVKVPFMHGTVPCRYARHGTLQAILMPYADDQFKFLAVAPVPGSDPEQVISLSRKGGLSAALRQPGFDHLSPEMVDVRMPRFDLSFMSDLRPALKRTSVAPMFEPGADFSGLTETPIAPSAVIQRVVMRVDEAGTEAAAVTAIPTERSFHEIPSFVAESPYLAVVLSKSGSMIVVALVTDPSRSAA